MTVSGPPSGFRPHMGLRVKLEAALLALGLEPGRVEFDHDPAIQLRQWDEAAQDTIPPASDPRYIVPREKDEHARKTNGTRATTAGSDQNRIAKIDRLTEAQEQFVANVLRKVPGRIQPKSKWPKRPLRSRGFERRA